MSAVDGESNWSQSASSGVGMSGSSSGYSRNKTRAVYGSGVPGGSKRNLKPAENRRNRKKLGSMSATDKKYEAVKSEASSNNSVTSHRHLPRYISELNDSERHTYVLCDRSTFFTTILCNRGSRDTRSTPKSLNLPKEHVRAIGCPVKLKAYCFDSPVCPDSPVYVLRRGAHNHPPGTHSKMSQHVRTKLKEFARAGLPSSEIVQLAARDMGAASSSVSDVVSHLQSELKASLTYTSQQVRYIVRSVAKLKYQLDPVQSVSVERWCTEKLGDRLLYRIAEQKTTQWGHVPFQLAFQSHLGAAMMGGAEKDVVNLSSTYHKNVATVDATYSLTKNHQLLLYSIIIRSDEGHICPVAHLITTSKSEEHLRYWFSSLKARFPSWRPQQFMTDCDNGQINAIRTVFPEIPYLLCSWHVIRNWAKKSGARQPQKSKAHSFPDDPSVSVDQKSPRTLADELFADMRHLMDLESMDVFLMEIEIHRIKLQAVILRCPTQKVRDLASYFLERYLNPSGIWGPRTWAHAYRDVKTNRRRM